MTVPSSLPNHNAYGSNFLNPQFTGEPNPEFAANTISKNIHENVRQNGSKLMGKVFKQNAFGEFHGFPIMNPGTSSTVTYRNRMNVTKELYDKLIAIDANNSGIYNPMQEITGAIRYAYPRIQKYEVPIGFTWDSLFSNISLGGYYDRDGAQAIGRDIDREIFDVGFFGSAIEGHNTSGNTLTQTAWNPSSSIATAITTGQYMIDSGGFGMTKPKLDAVNAWFDSWGLPQQGRNMAVTEKQKKDLIQNDILTSRDYIQGQPHMTAQIPEGLAGFNWSVIGTNPGPSSESSIIPTDSGTGERRCVAWFELGVGLGFWGDKPGKAWEDPMQDDAKFFRASSVYGAIRIEDKLVVEIRCNES